MSIPSKPHVVPFTADDIELARKVVERPSSCHQHVVRARLALVLASNPRVSDREAAWTVGFSTRTVRRWRRRWSVHGFSLKDLPRSGRPSSFSFKRILEILHANPRSFRINRSNWSLLSLSAAYENAFSQTISKSTVHRMVKQADYGWKKARRVLTSPDPNYREKVELLLRTLQSLQADDMFFFIDELGPLKVKKYGGRCYAQRGQTPTYPQNPLPKGSITLCGALSATTNQMTWFYEDTKDSAAMIDLVEILLNQHHDKSRIFITWDAASWHSSAELVQWLDDFNEQSRRSGKGPIIDFIPLPSCSQFLDVIEAVFSGMKRAVIHNSDYRSPQEMKSAISRHFHERNIYFKENPKRAGNKIWEIDFFQDHANIKAGNYREY